MRYDVVPLGAYCATDSHKPKTVLSMCYSLTSGSAISMVLNSSSGTISVMMKVMRCMA